MLAADLKLVASALRFLELPTHPSGKEGSTAQQQHPAIKVLRSAQPLPTSRPPHFACLAAMPPAFRSSPCRTTFLRLPVCLLLSFRAMETVS